MSKIALRNLIGTYGRRTPVDVSQVMVNPSTRANGIGSNRREESSRSLSSSASSTWANASSQKSITGGDALVWRAFKLRRESASAAEFADPYVAYVKLAEESANQASTTVHKLEACDLSTHGNLSFPESIGSA